MLVRLLIVAGVVVVMAVFTLWWRRREGAFTEASGRFDHISLGLSRTDKPSSVVVEFYGEHCAPCVVVERQLAKLAREVPELAVVRVDAGARLDLADRYNVRRVPTLFVADGDLRIIWRASGVPGEDAIRRALLGPEWAGRPHPGSVARPGSTV
ncbi:MAG: thioredoxin family protein [Actinomycetota bacterium]